MQTLGGWHTDILIGCRNLWRSPKRTLLACLAIAIAQITLIWINSFMNGYEVSIFETLTGPVLGHIQIHAPKYRDDEAIERVITNVSLIERQILNEPHVRSVSSRVYSPVLVALKETGHVARLTGLNVSQEKMDGGILQGLRADQVLVGQEILVGKGLAADMGLHPGDTLALMGQAVDGSVASGLYRIKAVIETSVDQINQSGVIMDLQVARDFLAMGDQVHEMVIHAGSQQVIPAVLSSLKSLPDLKPYEIMSWDELVPSLAELLKVASKSNYLILVLVFLTTIAGVANTMLMATFERIREFGMLLALGCRPKRIIRMLIIESFTLGIVGVGIGTVLGVALTLHGLLHGIDLSTLGGAKHDLNLSFEGMSLNSTVFLVLKLKDILNGVGAVCVTSIIASILPARRVGRIEPVEAMRS